MSPSLAPQPSFRWRTLLELTTIAAVIYAFLGAPGFPALSNKPSKSLKPATAKAKIESLVYPDENLQCPPHHGYEVHLFSTKPLVLYIDGFLSEEEAEELVEMSASNYTPSTVFNAGIESTDHTVRNSEKSLLPRTQLVQCLEARALAFQGWPADTYIERLWTQRYNVSGHYALHYDWASGSRDARRASTFMVYVQAPGGGGGTEFPRLKHPGRKAGWCEFVECRGEEVREARNGEEGEEDGGDVEGEEGVVFKPRRGAAVFWMNFDEDGRGYRETIHAGLPVAEGVKVGLNIWSWYQAGHVAPES